MNKCFILKKKRIIQEENIFKKFHKLQPRQENI